VCLLECFPLWVSSLRPCDCLARRTATSALRKKQMGNFFAGFADVMDRFAEQMSQTVSGLPEDVIKVGGWPWSGECVGDAKSRLALLPHGECLASESVGSPSAQMPEESPLACLTSGCAALWPG
jgi:hypothetical protein